MTDALNHAQYLEGFYVSEDVPAVKARAIAATLRSQHAEIERLRAELAQAMAERGRALTAAQALEQDADRLQFLEDQTMEGNAPNLVFDDDGNWCVSYTGMQPMPRGNGKGFDETVTIACVVEPNEWRPSIRAAIDAAMAEAASPQPA